MSDRNQGERHISEILESALRHVREAMEARLSTPLKNGLDRKADSA